MARQSRNQMQHEIHRLRREIHLLTQPYDGRTVLIRIARNLAQLHQWSDPISTPPIDANSNGLREWDRAEPGDRVRMFTSQERRFVRRLRVLAADLDAVVSPDGPVVMSRQERAALSAANARPVGVVDGEAG